MLMAEPLDQEELVKRMRAILDGTHEYTGGEYRGGHEDHITADDLLCETLRLLGYGELVDVYEQIPKWYS